MTVAIDRFNDAPWRYPEFRSYSFKVMQSVQRALGCCGLNTVYDYTAGDLELRLVPLSCCTGNLPVDRADNREKIVKGDPKEKVKRRRRHYDRWVGRGPRNLNWIRKWAIKSSGGALCDRSYVPKNLLTRAGGCKSKLDEFYFIPLFRWLRKLLLLQLATVILTPFGAYLFWKVKV